MSAEDHPEAKTDSEHGGNPASEGVEQETVQESSEQTQDIQPQVVAPSVSEAVQASLQNDDAIEMETSSDDDGDDDEDDDDLYGLDAAANVPALMWDGDAWMVGDDNAGWVFVDRRTDFVATCRKGREAGMALVEGFVSSIERRLRASTGLAETAVAADEIVNLCELLDAAEEDEKNHSMSAGEYAAAAAHDTPPASSSTSTAPERTSEPHAVAGAADDATEGARNRPESEETVKHSDFSDRTDAWWRRERLVRSPLIVDRLCQLLHRGDPMTQATACSALAGIAHNHVENATKLGSTEGILDGLVGALVCPGSADGDEERYSEERMRQEAGLQALVDLAMRNEHNKVAIVKFPGMLRALTLVLQEAPHQHAQDTAAMVIANCADNFAAGGGAEAAGRIVEEPLLLDALRVLLLQSLATLDTSANRSACLAAVVSLSDHPTAVARLRDSGMAPTLQTILASTGEGKAHEALRAEALMAMSNLSADLTALRGDEAVLRSVVQLVKYAIKGKRGKGRETIWAIRECLRPLARISVNAHNRRVLAADALVHKITIRVLLAAHPAASSSAAALARGVTASADQEESAGLALLLLSRILHVQTHQPRLLHLLRRPDVTDAIAWMAGRAETAGPGQGHGAEVEWDLPLFAERHVAMCMAMHPRLGAQSTARFIDPCVLQMVLQSSVSTPLAARCILASVCSSPA